MAWAIMGGLFVATLLTLLFLPALARGVSHADATLLQKRERSVAQNAGLSGTATIAHSAVLASGLQTLPAGPD